MRTKEANTASPEATASPVPALSVTPKTAPGQTGPRGLAPRTNYSRVNSGAPPAPDAGSAAQKSAPPMGATMLPKLANEDPMGATFNKIPTLQDMVKAAMEGAVHHVSISEEAARQSFDKVAAETCKGCGKEECKCPKKEASVSTDYALKLASAIEYAVPFMKEAENVQRPGEGPNALAVSEAKADGQLPERHGQAHSTVPMSTPLQKSLPSGPTTQMQNDKDKAPGGSGEQKVAAEQPVVAAPKIASAPADLADVLRAAVRAAGEKVAEDAANPAKISGGKSGDPGALQTSAAGEAGGAPVGGPPKGPTGLVGSNESAMNYNRASARSGRKSEMKNYIDEPMQTSSTDSTLNNVLVHSSAKDGNKMASAKDLAMKTAAAKALLAKLAEEQKDKKDPKDAKDKKSMVPGSDC